ncbi:hypothetical protein [Sphingomonas pituitosa]|uniref:hypothetical protein n=1 Tax=Sphingomonas pituitosa TaxID=99597 RepID=UPI00082C417B|nr:hypothetical protein [Sphingomonas pituitosa]
MKRRRPQPQLCDVIGCGRSRVPLRRVCDRCRERLPAEIRIAIEEAHHQRRWCDHLTARRQAGAFLNLPVPTKAPATITPSISPQRAYELQARMLGERSEP